MWCPEVAGSTMLASSKIKDGILTYEFSSLLSELLHEPEMYQKISMSQQRLFKASYSLALWENCIRFVGTGRTGLSEISEWKSLLGATSKTYDEFKYFNKFVLIPAIKEVNQVSSIEIDLLTQKTGRKVTHIGFAVKQKRQIQLAIPDVINDLKASKEYEDLIDLGIQHIQAISWLQEYDNQYIRSQIDFVKDEQAKGKIKSSLSGFLVSAIKGQYKNEKQVLKEKQEKEKQRQLEEDRKRKKESLINKAGLEFSKFEKEQFLSSLTDEQKEDLLKEILEEVSLDSFAVSHIKKKGLDSPSASLFIINRINDFSARKKKYIAEKIKDSGF
jgi:plasmid replication initiation protein